MTRAQGFARGDLDTSFPLDDKFLALRGRLNAERYYAGVGVYWTVVAAVWREAERKVALRIVPDAADLIDELVAVGLLDPDGRVPTRAFTNHIGRARRARKGAAERQANNRARKSREVTRDSGVTSRDSAPLRSAGTVGTNGTETGGAGGRNGRLKPSTVDRDPVLRQMREAQTARYAAEDAASAIVPLPRRAS